jgi:hypothetical protein
MADYTPTNFIKPSTGLVVKATSWSEHYQLLWDGYVMLGNAPAVDPATIPATMKDINSVLDLGPGLVGEAFNQTAIAPQFTSTIVAVFGTLVMVPPSPARSVTLKGQMACSVVTPPSGGHGIVMTSVCDVTTGAPVAKEYAAAVVPSTAAANDSGPTLSVEYDAGPSDTWRAFQMYVITNKSAAATTYPVMKVTNYIGVFSSWLKAVVQ